MQKNCPCECYYILNHPYIFCIHVEVAFYCCFWSYFNCFIYYLYWVKAHDSLWSVKVKVCQTFSVLRWFSTSWRSREVVSFSVSRASWTLMISSAWRRLCSNALRADSLLKTHSNSIKWTVKLYFATSSGPSTYFILCSIYSIIVG